MAAQAQEHGGVGDDSVDDRERLNTLVAGVVLTAGVLDVDVETDLGVVDRDALESKTPVPRERDLRKMDVSTPRE